MAEGNYLNISVGDDENGEDRALEVSRHEDEKGVDLDPLILNNISSKDNEDEENGVDLDASIWSNLPFSDTFERVLAHLPMAALARARTVSRKLNNVISSNSFLSSQADLGCAAESWLAFLDENSGDQICAYDPVIHKWYEISLAFLPWQVRILASAGGLICCKGDGVLGVLALVVCNPMTKKFRVLPPMLKLRFLPLVCMVVRGKRGEFMVVVIGGDVLEDGTNSDLSWEIFDSRLNRWSLSESAPPHSHLGVGCTFCSGNLYMITFYPDGVLSFNLQHGVWAKLQAPMPKNLIAPRIVDCSGRLLMIGGVVKKFNIGSIRVWELSENGIAWREIARMKDCMFRELWADKGKKLYFTALGHGNLIYIVIFQSTLILALDINTRRWFWLPPSPMGRVNEIWPYPYNPNLYTDVA